MIVVLECEEVWLGDGMTRMLKSPLRAAGPQYKMEKSQIKFRQTSVIYVDKFAQINSTRTGVERIQKRAYQFVHDRRVIR